MCKCIAFEVLLRNQNCRTFSDGDGKPLIIEHYPTKRHTLLYRQEKLRYILAGNIFHHLTECTEEEKNSEQQKNITNLTKKSVANK